MNQRLFVRRLIYDLKRRYGPGAWPLLVIFVLLLAAPHLAARIRASP